MKLFRRHQDRSPTEPTHRPSVLEQFDSNADLIEQLLTVLLEDGTTTVAQIEEQVALFQRIIDQSEGTQQKLYQARMNALQPRITIRRALEKIHDPTVTLSQLKAASREALSAVVSIPESEQAGWDERVRTFEIRRLKMASHRFEELARELQAPQVTADDSDVREIFIALAGKTHPLLIQDLRLRREQFEQWLTSVGLSITAVKNGIRDSAEMATYPEPQKALQ